jgi:phosphoribosylformylglycinamidine cyclo-ligase
VGDLVRTIIVDSTVTCRMKREDVISADKISAGNVIIGLSSTGQATYENEYNGGMGSNGLTSADTMFLPNTWLKNIPKVSILKFRKNWFTPETKTYRYD